MVPYFRVFIKEYKKVADVVFIDYEDKYVLCKVVFEENNIPHEMEFTFDEVEFMKSTGLKDKNGVEIFEGDIIVAMSQGVKAIGVVKRRIDGYWLMYPAWQHGEFWHIVENVDTGETGVEVIGNIWEDGDLIDNKKSETD